MMQELETKLDKLFDDLDVMAGMSLTIDKQFKLLEMKIALTTGYELNSNIIKLTEAIQGIERKLD